MKTQNDAVQKYILAFRQKEVKDAKRNFYWHFTFYILVNAFLVFANLHYEPSFHWFWFPLLSWGIGLVSHLLFGVLLLPRFPKVQEKKVLEKLLKN